MWWRWYLILGLLTLIFGPKYSKQTRANRSLMLPSPPERLKLSSPSALEGKFRVINTQNG